MNCNATSLGIIIIIFIVEYTIYCNSATSLILMTMSKNTALSQKILED